VDRFRAGGLLVCLSLWSCTGAALARGGNELAGEKWIGLATPNFELYTTNDLALASEALEHFEAIHSFFAEAGLLSGVAGGRVQIIAFGSDQEYKRYSANPGAFAYYQRTRKGDYIVMRDLAPEHYEISMHEYTHYVFQHSGLTLPLWVNEGLADLYSSVESQRGRALLGKAPSGRLYALQTRPWIDLNALFSVAHGSPYYSQAEKMQTFYAESWGLIHMLALSSSYAPQFRHFLDLLSNGTSASQGFQDLYRKSVGEVTVDLEEYVKQRQLPALLLNIDLNASRITPARIRDPQVQADFALADLAAATPAAEGAGQMQLNSLSTRYPDNPQAEESLGYLAIRQNRPEEARAHFRKAVERHSTSPEVIFYLAHLEHAAGNSGPEIVKLLEQVIELEPTHYNARLELGMVATKGNQFELAISTLAKLGTVRPEHAYVVTYTMAYCFVQLHKTIEARAYGEKARQLASNNKEQEQAERLLSYLERTLPAESASSTR
jgi:Flp pilus assembly protein TadD